MVGNGKDARLQPGEESDEPQNDFWHANRAHLSCRFSQIDHQNGSPRIKQQDRSGDASPRVGAWRSLT